MTHLRLTLLALAPLAVPVLFAAPAATGCGTRQVSTQPAEAEPTATAPTAEAAPVATEPASATQPTAPVAPSEPPPPASALAGDYECRVARGDRDLPPAPCAIRAGADGALHLEQTAGQMRLSGAIVEDEAGFRLTGQLTCTRGPCPGRGARELRFFRQGETAFSAVLALRSGLFVNFDLVRVDQSTPMTQ
jgi:hypothetical protein